MKTKEELHLVMTAPPPPPPPVYEPVNYHVQEGLQDEGAEPMGYSAELSSEGILDDRNEEKRITEAEKNERVQRQLLVSGLSPSSEPHPWYSLRPLPWSHVPATPRCHCGSTVTSQGRQAGNGRSLASCCRP